MWVLCVAFWGVVRLQRDLALFSSCSLDQEDARGVGPTQSWAGIPGASRVWAVGLGIGGWMSRWRQIFCWLLSRRHFGATRSGCRAGALGQVRGTTSVCLWSAQQSPLLQDQTGQWERPGSRGRGFYPHPSSPSGLTTGGARAPQGELCTSDKNGTAFTKTPQNVLFYKGFSSPDSKGVAG